MAPHRSARVFLALGLLLATAMLAGCTRGPDDGALRQDVQRKLNDEFKAGVLDLVSLKRQGSSALASADGQGKRRVVYFNATMAFAQDYDFSAWEGLSPAVLATVLGATEKGLSGIRTGVNRKGDFVTAYGSALYEATGDGWRSIRTGPAAPAPPRPAVAEAAAPVRARQLVDALASHVNAISNPEGPQSKVVEDELDRALRDITLRLGELEGVLTFASGPPGGAYARFGDALADRGGRAGVKMQSVPTQGSVDNSRLVARGEATLGIVQADVAALALAGEGPFDADGPLARLRALGSLFPEPIHLVVRGGSSIRRVSDLRGKRVDLGQPDSGTRHDALAVLLAHGLAIEDLGEATQDGFARALERLEAEELDGLFETTVAPAPALQALAARKPLRLVPLEPSGIRTLTTDRAAGRVALDLPANTYQGQGAPVATVATTALLVTRVDLPAGDAARLLRLVYDEGADYLARGSAAGAKVSKPTAKLGVTIPLHPEADRYFALEQAPAASAPQARGAAGGKP